MGNPLEIGSGGLVAPSPADDKAVPPSLGLPSPGPSQMREHFASQQDQAKARFDQIKELAGQVDESKKQLEKLAAYGDTVTMDEIIESAAAMVAAGISATHIAGNLAEIPTANGQLQGWVQEQLQKLGPQEQKVQTGLAAAGHQLAVAGLRQVIGHSAEAHYNAKQRVAALVAMPVQGRA